ncbi:DUF4785 domain-containing protein [Dyella silvatica]|uniref:DUF4785 domain-containing protein n=1 Tax=Dyella silvatica TaxID=2992128 RepID=UPI00225B9A8A|nr:DUF4785 domain-containing protein [Dyella silvatica]
MRIRILTLALLAGTASMSALAASESLLPPQSDDLVPTLIHARATTVGATSDASTARFAPAPQIHLEHQPIQVSWALDPAAPLDTTPQPISQRSREYWTDVSSGDLQRGVELPLSAPGAIIRLSPGQGSGKISPADVHLQLGNQNVDGNAAASHIADASALKAAGMDVAEASLAMQLRPELGSGHATLKAANANRAEVLLGDSVQVTLSLQDGSSLNHLQTAGGYLRAPNGDTTLLHFQQQADGRFVATATPTKEASSPGLWQVQSFTLGTDANGQDVRRDVTSTFAVAAADVRFSGGVEPKKASDGGIDIALAVDAKNASRYAVSGVLYGRGTDGQMHPGAYAQSAAWLAPGNSQLHLHFDANSTRHLAPPYELRDLRLQDQPAMGLVERRALALRFAL